ncbi:hypothetical protein MSG28_002775 [Choristoneura fumiferana]|uniref:Uncharacterized protein n=1 Tax=Choristoneura fumiferana TaxID=7141 RepID=A0ACC0JK24_CHOFU|nr:hypothetical protein MSG28_002775 [Choristoneura fumiferana]
MYILNKQPKTAMVQLYDRLVDKVADTCVKLYNGLPKTGKPIDNEWTVLSCLLQYDKISENLEVVSLGTGSKCIGASKMSPFGDVLNDSHAEVFARRGFLIYLYDNIEQALQSKKSIFIFENGKFTLKDNIEFIFYSSQLPCGDASIIPKEDEENFGEVLQSLKQKACEDISDIDLKKINGDIHRTGAKCLPDSAQDSKEPGTNYHLLGQVRIKPGRGDRTQSVSCSDKIARWIHIGVQGALLDLLINKPFFIHHFVFGAGVPYSEESLTRSLLKRTDVSMVIPDVMPKFYQSRLVFPHIKSDLNVRPAAGSIVWSKSRAAEGVESAERHERSAHELSSLQREFDAWPLASPGLSLFRQVSNRIASPFRVQKHKSFEVRRFISLHRPGAMTAQWRFWGINHNTGERVRRSSPEFTLQLGRKLDALREFRYREAGGGSSHDSLFIHNKLPWSDLKGGLVGRSVSEALNTSIQSHSSSVDRRRATNEPDRRLDRPYARTKSREYRQRSCVRVHIDLHRYSYADRRYGGPKNACRSAGRAQSWLSRYISLSQ